MKIRFWGTRGSIAKPGPTTIRYGGNTSCVELLTDAGTLVIFDCGTGAHELGRELVRQKGTATRGHILISHTHWDHIQGIPFFEPFFEAGGEWDIYGPKGLLQSIRDTLAGQMEYTYFPIGVEKFGATIRYHDLVEGAFSIDDVHIVTQYLNHPALTLGYRVRADNATMVYCCDHEPNVAAAGSGKLEITGQDRRHVEFLAGADLVIHDSQFTAQEYPQRVGWGHSPAEYVVQVCQAAGVKQVFLTHHDPLRDDDAVDQIVAGLRQRVAGMQPPLAISAAAEGQLVEIAPTHERSRATASAQFEAHAPTDAVSLRHPLLLKVTDGKIGGLLQEAMRLEGLADPIVPQTADLLSGNLMGTYSLALIQHDPPALDGLAIARRIQQRQIEAGMQLPVVLVTSDPAQVGSGSTAVIDWLLAPFSLSYARTKLRYWTLRLSCRWVRAQLPADEAQRLAALYELAVLDTPPEERFDRITRIAAATFDVPIALISLVDKDRQWFKSCVGIDVSETPRDVAFCAHAVERRADVVVPDTLQDDRFADNPLVTGGPRIRFYAGAPLLLKNGACLGTLCIVDTRPRQLSATDLTSLHDLRDMVLEQLARPQPDASPAGGRS
jgi:phosphoribosyl 1,2-cyclic phosphodiesterase/DNA-binding response OmpR family regulator